MTRHIATEIVEQLTNYGLDITIEEAMRMVKIPTDGYDVFSIQKGDVTILAWVRYDGSISTTIVCW